MKKISGFIISMLFATSSLMSEIPPKYEVEAHKVTLFTARDLHGRFGLDPLGLGGGMIKNIQNMSLTLRTYKAVTLEQARKLVRDCVELYLKNINASSEIRSFLAEHPFTVKRLGLMFLVLDKDDHFKTVNSLANFYLEDGKIVYKTCNPKTHMLEKVHEETYEAAMEILTGQHTVPK